MRIPIDRPFDPERLAQRFPGQLSYSGSHATQPGVTVIDATDQVERGDLLRTLESLVGEFVTDPHSKVEPAPVVALLHVRRWPALACGALGGGLVLAAEQIVRLLWT